MRVVVKIDDGNTLLAGEVKRVDASYDHEFGTERCYSFELDLDSVKIITCIDKVDWVPVHDYFKEHEPKRFNDFCDLLIEKAWKLDAQGLSYDDDEDDFEDAG